MVVLKTSAILYANIIDGLYYSFSSDIIVLFETKTKSANCCCVIFFLFDNVEYILANSFVSAPTNSFINNLVSSTGLLFNISIKLYRLHLVQI